MIRTLARAILPMLAASLLLPACGDSGGGTDVTRRDAADAAPPTDVAPTDEGPAPDAPVADATGDGAVPDAGPDGPPPPPVEELRNAVDREEYLTDLTFVAEPRPPGSKHHQAVQDLCFDRLTELGYTVERHDYGGGVNVIGRLVGDQAPDEQIVLSAHYDSIPGCPGADDNGTGVAGVLQSAKALAQARYARTLVIACWDEEETGLVGSYAWATEAAKAGEQVIYAVSFETFGYRSTDPGTQEVPVGFDALFAKQAAAVKKNKYRGDFIAVVADEDASEPVTLFEEHATEIGLPYISLIIASGLRNSPALADLRRSDHASFWSNDYPGIMLTDTANFRNAGYHCEGAKDTIDRLDHDFAVSVVRAMVGATAELLGPTRAP